MNREFWKRDFFSEKKPIDYPCPTCKVGKLKLDPTKVIKRETAAELEAQRKHEFVNKSDRLLFISIPACSNAECKEVVTISGHAVPMSLDMDWALSPGTLVNRYHNYYPKHFYPPLRLFPISEHCPANIREEIIKAFSHYWNDLSSSANRIRNAVELMMDEQGVEKTFINTNGKQDEHRLHKRIELYKQINPDAAHSLMAVKWIGNVGSHPGELNKDDILDGFELLEDVIDEVYYRPKRKAELKQKADAINTNKGPVTGV